MLQQDPIHEALALHTAGRLAEAEAIYRQILVANPNHPDALHLLGNIALSVGQIQVAIDLITRATQFAPSAPQMFASLGHAYANAGLMNQAIACYRRAVELQPDWQDARFFLGQSLIQFDHAAAERELLATMKLGPPHLGALLALSGLYWITYRMDEAEKICRLGMDLFPDERRFHTNLILTIPHKVPYNPQLIADEHRRWGEKYADPLAVDIQPHTNNRDPDRRLRMGYVSTEFGEGAASHFIRPILSSHDHEHFEIFCYSGSALASHPITLDCARHADTWLEVRAMSDAQLAEKIREDRIDLLVDLSGHVQGNRLLTFARQPAPVQASYVTYPETCGVKTIQYRFSDALVNPPGMTEKYFVEEIIRLPKTGYCFQPPDDAPPVSPSPIERNGFVTFGSTNRISKMEPAIYAAWARILTAVPKSKLIIQCFGLQEAGVREPVLQQFAAHGIGADRLKVIGWTSIGDYLNIFSYIDLVLDTFPFNGHTTTCHALWMGVPVVSVVGQSHIARMGVTVLTNIGLPELIAEKPAQYEQLAIELAKDPKRLAELRSTMRARMLASPMLDARTFTRNLESAYRDIWRRWCKSI